jgi:hypothetical protein
MNFEIKLPPNPISREEIKAKNKRLFKDDFDKDGILAKTLIFTKMCEPLNSQELQTNLRNYYKIEFDVNLVKRSLKRLNELGILNSITSGEIMSMPQHELNELYKEIYRKFFLFLDHIPKQFRRQYNQVNYYWVSNGVGSEYLEWCANILGFEIIKKEKENE